MQPDRYRDDSVYVSRKLAVTVLNERCRGPAPAHARIWLVNPMRLYSFICSGIHSSTSLILVQETTIASPEYLLSCDGCTSHRLNRATYYIAMSYVRHFSVL